MEQIRNGIDIVGIRDSHHIPPAPIVIQASAEAVIPEISIVPPFLRVTRYIQEMQTASGINPHPFIANHLPPIKQKVSATAFHPAVAIAIASSNLATLNHSSRKLSVHE